ncbi:MAG: hypothetical protein U0Q15_06930 [Kineosporiaceae bacterium]
MLPERPGTLRTNTTSRPYRGAGCVNHRHRNALTCTNADDITDSRSSDTSQVELSDEDVDRLDETPWVERGHAPALVVCVDPALRDLDPSNHRLQVGWDPTLKPFDQIQMDGVRQWWPCAAPNDVEVVVVTNHGWVLWAYEVAGDPRRHDERARWSFDVLPRETDRTKAFIGRRLPPKPGPVAYPLA